MEGGAPKGRRLEGESGMKESEEMHLKYVVYESTLSTAGAVPLPRWGRLRGGGFAAIICEAMPDQESFSPLPLEGADERSEKFLSFAVKRIMSEKRKRETCSPQTFGHRLIYICGARVLSYNGALETISLSFMPLSPSNLRPFGAPPSIGRRE